jgi:hypothetical protein
MGAGNVGLCATCVHCRVIRARRSVFYMCQRSFTDERFPKYPPLPVVRCVGHTPGSSSTGERSVESPDGEK